MAPYFHASLVAFAFGAVVALELDLKLKRRLGL